MDPIFQNQYRILNLRIRVYGDISGSLENTYKYGANTDLSSNLENIYIPSHINIIDHLNSNKFNTSLFNKIDVYRNLKNVFLDELSVNKFVKNNSGSFNETIMYTNANFLINRLFNKGDNFYIKCHPFIIEDISNINCEEREKFIESNTYSIDKLKYIIKEDNKNTLISYRKDLLDSYSLSIKESILKNINDVIEITDIEGFANFTPSKVAQLKKTIVSIDDDYEKYRIKLFKEKLDISNIKTLAEKIKAKLENSKIAKKYNIVFELKYDKKTGKFSGISSKKNNNQLYCTVSLQLIDRKKIEGISKVSYRLNCKNNFERVKKKLNVFCDKHMKNDDPIKKKPSIKNYGKTNLIYLMCEDIKKKYRYSIANKPTYVLQPGDLTSICKVKKGGKTKRRHKSFKKRTTKRTTNRRKKRCIKKTRKYKN